MITHKIDQCFKAVWGPSLQLSNTSKLPVLVMVYCSLSIKLCFLLNI